MLLRILPSSARPYNVLGVCGSITRVEMQHGGPGFSALQLAPLSPLLNRPAPVAAYTVPEFCGSIAMALTGPLSGPWRVHTLVPARSEPVPTMAQAAIAAS